MIAYCYPVDSSGRPVPTCSECGSMMVLDAAGHHCINCGARPAPCDTSTICPACSSRMQPEHAHYRCACGYRDSCCF